MLLQHQHPNRPAVRVWVTVIGADSLYRGHSDALKHFIRSNILSQQSLTFLAPGTGFTEDSFPMDQQGWEVVNSLGMIQAHCIYCALYIFYYDIRST